MHMCVCVTVVLVVQRNSCEMRKTNSLMEIATLEKKHALAPLLLHHLSLESDGDLDDLTSTNTPSPAPPLLQNPQAMSVIQFWKHFHIKIAINLLINSWRKLTLATGHHARQNGLEGLPGQKHEL